MRTFISKKIALLARSGADALNRKTAKLSPFKMKLYLLLFCVAFSAISTYFILEAILSKDMIANPVFVKRIPPPAHIGRTNDQRVIFFVTPAEYDRVEKIRNYLDSIARSDKPRYTEIVRLRPHLTDSIVMFEKLYTTQSKR
jgi:hypothetical protein